MHAPFRSAQRGMTLVELLVAIVISLFISLSILALLAGSEGRNRVSNGLNTIEQTSSLSSFMLDQWVRSAGSGLTVESGTFYGCTLYAKNSDGQTLPRTAALPDPFAHINPNEAYQFPLAPVLIFPGVSSGTNTPSDTLMIMGAAANNAGIPSSLTSAPGEDHLNVHNAYALTASQLVLIADVNGSNCMVTQISSAHADATATTVPLNGDFHAAHIDTINLADFSKDSIALPLGIPSTGTAPQMMLLGVGSNKTLYSYDLLQMSGSDDALQARASGILEMHAIYGVDTTNDGKQDGWVSASTGEFATTTLLANNSQLSVQLKKIKSVRVALVLQMDEVSSSRQGMVSAPSLTIFPDLAAQGLSITRTLTDDERRYRYRVVDTTLVMRNTHMLTQ